MKLLLADDHTLFRDALVEYIERVESDAEILLARDMNEVMEVAEAHKPFDIVLLDLRMPGMDGLKGLDRLHKTYPDTPIGLLSGMAEKADVTRALELGAVAYFPKTMSGKAMVKGIYQVMNGERFVPLDHNTNQIMPSYFHGPEKKMGSIGMEGGVPLTPREYEVLSHLQKGESNKEIARKLELQVVTIKLHVRSICRKLGAQNRTQAALKASSLERLT